VKEIKNVCIHGKCHEILEENLQSGVKLAIKLDLHDILTEMIVETKYDITILSIKAKSIQTVFGQEDINDCF
jgi:hypothetical protein